MASSKEPSLKKPDETPQINLRWWDHPGSERKEAALDMLATFTNIEMNQRGREAKDQLFARMYGGLSFMNGMKFSGALSIGAAGNLSVAQSPRYNLGWSLTDTEKSIICKDDTRCAFLTDDADWELQERAKKLEEFTQGIFYQTAIYDIGEEVYGDADIFGRGFMKVWERFDNIDVRRVFPNSLKVDIWDGADRKPRCIYETWIEDRDVLCAMFKHDPAAVKAIRSEPSVTAVGNYAINATCNMVEVKESFHLRSDPNDDEAHDGRHMIVLAQSGYCLEFEPFDWDCFPYVVIRRSKTLVGWQGMGLCELLVGHQRELNRTLQVEATSHHIMSVPRVALDINSKVPKNHVTSNKPGPVWWYQGTAPIALNWNAVTGDFVQWKEWIIASAHDFTGISEMAAQAKKPLGLDSAVAQREFKDTQSDRLAIQQKRHDQMYLDATLRIIKVARQIFERTGKLPTKFIGRNFAKTIDWEEVSMQDEEFRLKLWPSSMLPKTPAGRLQAVQELIQAGFIDKDTGMRLLNFPDLASEMGAATAKQENIHMVLNAIINKGKYQTPDPTQALDYGLQYGQQLYLETWDKGVKPERRARLIQWMAAARASQQQTLAAAAAKAAPPLARPAAPPVSQLLPNAPQPTQ